MKSTLTFLVLLVIAAAVCAQFTPITQLGEPLRNIQAAEKQWKYFQLDVDAVIGGNIKDTDDLTFLVTPYSGDVDLYISTNNFPSSPSCEDCWKSTSPHGDVITIAKSDRKWPVSPAKFYIGCYSRTPSVFSVNTWLTDTSINVYDGEPQTASIIRGRYTFFKYYLDEAANFSIAVTPISGDPDLYVSTIYQFPNATHREWAQSEWGIDIIPVFDWSQHFKAPGWYYISVYAYWDTYFTLAVSKFKNYTLLVDSVPLAEIVPRTEYRYFKFLLNEDNVNMVVNVNPVRSRGVAGDPDLYVNYGVDYPTPSRSNYQWSQTVSGADTLTIKNARKGWYYIAIYGWTTTVFDIYASIEGKNSLLLDGIPVNSGVSQGQYNYFKFYHGDYQSGVTFTATLHRNCDAKLFISTVDSRPQEDKHELTGFKVGNELIRHISSPKVGNYYIGVLGVTAQCNFTIQAVTNQSYTMLREGEVSYFNYAPAGFYRFFIFDVRDTTQDAIFSVNPWNGEVDIYADLFVKYPKRGNATYRSETYKADTLVIPAQDIQAAGWRHRRIYIGVRALSDSYFAITASLANNTQTLNDGIPLTGAVTVNGHRYYRFYNPNDNAAVTIQMELINPGFYTNADLYASSTIRYPNEWEYTWRSQKFGNDFLQIDYAPKGWIHVTVHGASGVGQINYRLTANIAYTYVWPNSASVLVFGKKDQTQTFNSLIWGCDYVLAAVTLISGKTQIYLSTNATAPAGPNNYKWRDTNWPGNVILAKKDGVSYSDREDRRYWSLSVKSDGVSSSYFVSVVCVRHSYYYLWSAAAQIMEGVPRLGIAPGNNSILYGFYIGGDNTGKIVEDYRIYIRVFSGSVQVDASQDWRVHPHVNATFHSTGNNDRIMRLSKDQLKQGTLFISVFGLDINSKYEISVSRNSHPRFLTQDQPVQTIVNPTSLNTPTYYRVLNDPSDPLPLYVTTESCSLKPAPQIFVDSKNPTPGPSGAQASSKPISKFAEAVVMPPSRDVSIYYVGVAGSPNPTHYEITSSLVDSKPVVSDKQLVGMQREHGQLGIVFKRAQFKFNSRHVRYYIYKRTMKMEGGVPEEVNMETPCGVRYNAKLDGSIQDIADKPNIEYLIDVDRTQVYMVNVVVQDGYGLNTVYKAGWIVDGRMFPAFPGLNPFQVSAGFILMLIAFTAFVAYLLIGSIVNVIRGKRGLEIIPNLAFWKDLPFLVWDGMQMVFCCCKNRGNYSEFQDEPSAVNTSGFDAQPEPIATGTASSADEPKETTKAPSQSGYGTL